MTGKLVTADPRGRISLGKPDQHFLMVEEPDGTVILQPASVITDLERRFLENAALQAQIEFARKHPEQRVARKKRA